MKISAEWMKLDVNIFSHPKIRRIRRMPEGDSVFTLWIYFLCEGMKNSDNPGVIELTAGIPAEDLDIADDIRIKIDTVRMAITTFHELGMIITDEFSDAIAIKNIRKHQSIDQLEYKRELNRQRVNKFRQKKNSLEIENTSKDVMHYSNAGNEQRRVEKIRVDKSRLDKNKETKKKTKSDKKSILIPDTLSADINFLDTWEKWVTYRTELKKKLTNSTAIMQLKKLEKFGSIVAIAMIEKSIESGWLGLFEIKNNSFKSSSNTTMETRSNVSQDIEDGKI